MLQKKETPILMLALLLAIAAVPKPSAVSLRLEAVLAQPATPTPFPVPTSVPQGTIVRLDGSNSMTGINQTLKQKFEQQYPSTQVTVAESSTPAALQALLEGKLDLVAIGRSLSVDERAKGLDSRTLSRHKIAIIVGADNPHIRDLSDEEFAKIFRGQITDWSQVRGKPGAIRFIDRPASSDTRIALKNYPVFKTAPFESGANAIKLSEDSTSAIVQQLGKDGISYAIADQVVNLPGGVRALTVHGVPPTDPRYNFSQPLGYAFNANQPTPAAQYFLGFATAAANQATIEAAKTASAVTALNPTARPAASPAASPTAPEKPTSAGVPAEKSPAPAPTATTALVPGTPRAEAPPQPATNPPGWLWLLPLIAVGVPFMWWLLKDPEAEAAENGAFAAAGVAARSRQGQIILVPRDCRHAYAYWDISTEHQEAVRQQGGEQFQVRLYDVTDLDLRTHEPHSVQQFDCQPAATDLQLPIPVDNRDYVADLGYTTVDGRWLSLATSEPIHVPDCGSSDRELSDNEPGRQITETQLNANGLGFVGAAVASGTALAAGAAAQLSSQLSAATRSTSAKPSRLLLESRQTGHAFASWYLTEAQQADLQRQGRDRLAVRLYDVTGIDPNQHPNHNFQQFDCDLQTREMSLPLPSRAQDYVAELGYPTSDNRWVRLLRSETLRGASVQSAAVASGSAIADPIRLPGAGGEPPTAATGTPPSLTKQTRVILVPRTADDAYVYWELSEADKAAIAQQPLSLRLYDTTGIDLAHQAAHAVTEHTCSATSQDTHIPIAASDRDYIADLGYVTAAGAWKSLARSQPAWVPPQRGTPADERWLSSPDPTLARAAVASPPPSEPAPAAATAVASSTAIAPGDSQITISSGFWQDRGDQPTAYISWAVSPERQQAQQQQGGQQLILRVYDVTNIDLDHQPAHSFRDYACEDSVHEMMVPVPEGDRDYVAEIGYLTADNQLLSLARSLHTRIPPIR